MPWRPEIFKSKRKKGDGESPADSSRPESRSDAQRDAQGDERRKFVPSQYATFEAHPGTPWTPEQEDPTSTSSVGPRGSMLSIRGFDRPSHKRLNRFVQEDSRLSDDEHHNVGVQSSDDEDEPGRPTSSRSRTEPTKRSDWQAARRRVLGRRTPGEREDGQPSWEAGEDGEISFKNPWMQEREKGENGDRRC